MEPRQETLEALLLQVNKKKFEAYIDDAYEGCDDEVKENSLGDREIFLDLLEQYLQESCDISVNDVGLIEFGQLYSNSACNVRKTIGDLPVALYHHTATGAIPGIISRGGLVTGRDLGFKPTKYDSGAYVFLTTELNGPVVDGYVSRALQRFGGDPVTLTVKTKLHKIRFDPDDKDISSGRVQFVQDFVPLSDIVDGLQDTENVIRNPWRAGTVGVFPYAENTGRLLVGLRSRRLRNSPSTWAGFGGTMHRHENAREAAMRELWEETQIEPHEVVDLEEFAPGLFLAYTKSEVPVSLNWETEQAYWMDPDMAEELEPLHWGLEYLLENMV